MCSVFSSRTSIALGFFAWMSYLVTLIFKNHTSVVRPKSRLQELTAPWLLDGPMNRAAFDVYIETQLAPTLQPGDVVIADNLSSHKSAYAQNLLKAQGNWMLFLPPYSPDLNPIEMAFAKLKAHLRRMAARTFDAITEAVGDICDLFLPEECENYFKACGYEFINV